MLHRAGTPGRIARSTGWWLVVLSFVGLSASAQIAPFTEEANLRGISAVTYPAGFGNGIALEDFDGDGDLDFLLTGANAQGAVRLYANTGGGFFVGVTSTSGLPVDPLIRGVSVADYDADGLLDLYLSSDGSDSLYRNQGGLTFVDVTSTVGISGVGSSQGATWADYDGDQWLDLYVPYLAGPSGARLYRNVDGVFFEDVTQAVGLDVGDSYAFQAQFFDHDRDGDPDLYLTKDLGPTPNRLYRNEGGVFVEVGSATGTALQMGGMGIAIADVNGDLRYDLLLSDNIPLGCRLLASDGDEGYTDVAAALGLTMNVRAWGVLFFDADNDGLWDTFATTTSSENHLHRGLPGGGFEDVTAATGVGTIPGVPPVFSQSFAATAGDIDGDGDVDLIVSSSNQPLALFVNSDAGQHHWLEVELTQGGGNRFAVGATVEIVVEGVQRIAPIVAGTGLRSSVPLRAHFGLGSTTEVDQIVVHWPDGPISLVGPSAVDQRITIDRSPLDAFLDCNGNWIDDALDISSGSSGDINGDGVPDECQELFVRGDSDGNGVVDLADVVVLLSYLFLGGELPCPDGGDVTDSGSLDVADPILLLSALFLGASGEVAPPSECGTDPTIDLPAPLGCPGAACY
ncbi:MAG: CRTAC1 family protein [Planctomycetes bacterium]|nr:CRTAC1 family protein [Planctomycetota bacterium]